MTEIGSSTTYFRPSQLHYIICSKNKNIWNISQKVSSSIRPN